MNLGEGKTTEGRGLGDSKHAGRVGLGSVRGRFGKGGIKGESEVKKGKKRKEFIVWEDVDGVESVGEMESMSLVDEWKLKGEVKERRNERDRKTREREGWVERGKLEEMSREEVLEAKRDLDDYVDLVRRTERVFGVERSLAVGFCVDVAVRRLERSMFGVLLKGVEKGDGKKVNRRLEEESKKGVLAKELENFKVVKEGRLFGEVGKGVGPGVKKEDWEMLEKKKDFERMEEEKKKLEREEKEEVSLEVVMDSQEERSGVWDLKEMEKDLGLKENDIKRVEERSQRVRVVVRNREVLEKGMEASEEEWSKVVKGEVKEKKRLAK